VVAAFAAFDELRQMSLPGRDASLGDFATDVAAAGIAVALLSPWLKRVLAGRL